MTDEALRAAERAWRARPGDPALRDAVVAARRRAGLAVAPALLGALPRERPRLVWERPCLPCDFGWAERPVVGSGVGQGLVLLAGGEDRTGDPAALLEGFALEDGRPLLRIDAELPSTIGGEQASEPALLADGTIAFVVYEHGVRTRALHLDPAGRLLDAQELEGTQGYDVGIKLFLGPVTPLAGRDHLVTWLYRQVREYRTERRRPGQAAPVWSAPELLIAAAERVAVGLTTPARQAARDDPLGPDGAHLVGRELDTGVERWRRPASHLVGVGHLAPGLDHGRERLLVVDRGARVASKRALDLAAEEALLAATRPEAELGDLLDEVVHALPPEPARVLALDPETGATAWEHAARGDGPGEVVGLAVAPGGVSVHVRDATGQRLVHLDPDGRPLGEAGIAGPGLGRWEPGLQHEWPALVARDVDAVLLASEARLECLALDGAPRWSLPLPAACAGFHPRRADRLLPRPSVVVHEGRLVLRGGRRVWVYA